MRVVPTATKATEYSLLANMIAMQRSAKFVAITFAVTAPYMAFTIYCAFHFPQSQWPRWVAYILLIWFVANILIMTFVARKMFRKPKTDAEIQATAIEKAKFARFRWLWFAMAIFAVLGTPSAIIDGVHLAQTDHRLILPTILGLFMRAGWIYLFLWLWWKYRPRTQP